MINETSKLSAPPVADATPSVEGTLPLVASAAPSQNSIIVNPVRFFLKSNIFRAITVLLMIVYIYASLYLPVFSVYTEHPYSAKASELHFSLVDVLGDLENEVKLCYILDIEKNPEDFQEYLSTKKNSGKFTQAMDISLICNSLKEESKNDTLFSELFSNDAERGTILIAYSLLPFPIFLIIGLAVSTFISMIATIVSFFNPTAQIKKLDASICLTITIFFALCHLTHLLLPCFHLNLVMMGLLTALSIAAMVFHTIYRRYTIKIINQKLGLY